MKNESKYDDLILTAVKMREAAYAPYSHFTVGAALLGGDGKIYTGCNIENAAYPVGICAERTAFSKAISEGCRSFEALAVVGAPEDRKGSDICAPCGMCRQFIREFCGDDFPVILAGVDDDGNITERRVYRFCELLPESFGAGSMK